MAVLGASNLTFADVTARQVVEDFVAALCARSSISRRPGDAGARPAEGGGDTIVPLRAGDPATYFLFAVRLSACVRRRRLHDAGRLQFEIASGSAFLRRSASRVIDAELLELQPFRIRFDHLSAILLMRRLVA